MQKAQSIMLAALALLCCSCGRSGEPKTEGAQTDVSAGTQTTSGAPTEGVEVLLCDGKTKTIVPEGTSGTAIAGSLMAKWLEQNPDRNWEAEERERHELVPAADNSDLLDQKQAQTYGRVSERDVLVWKLEAEKLATAGSRVFHSADELGSTIAVSCDMCHPHAANTHPETYPKFQKQLGRVALLRDMINWCLEHPVRAKPLSSDDPRMRALEGYILAQRKGAPLNYGRR